MKELIKIQEKNGIPTVNARVLYEELDIKTKYADWIKYRIDQYNFIENEDYIKASEISETPGGKQNTIEYHLTINMAKELSMVENNEKGKEYRKYFIRVEEAYKNGKREKKQLRDKSKEVRNSFTNMLRDRGYTKPGHYIQTSKQMKGALNIICKKDKMTNTELKAITAAEMISGIKIEQSSANGYHEVNPICVECSNVVALAINDTNQIIQEVK